MFDSEASSSCGDLSKLFEVKELASSESLQLFNWYAFGRNSMPESFMEYARCLVKHCGGIPLALQVLGSSLCSKSTSVWKSASEKLDTIPDNKIQKILRISYDSLEDDHDKNLFLDIACFFIGKDRDYTSTILDGCDFYTTFGIENLIGRSLLIINEKNKLMMHQMVRDMGREIIRQESYDIEERSRLWHKDAFDVITEKTGSKTIKGLNLDLKALLEDKSKRTTTSLRLSNVADMETRAFAKMQRLKLLQLDYVKLKGDFKDFPKGLKWLRWRGCPMQYLPVDFHIKRLVALDMRNNNLKQVLNDRECLPCLKILNLNHSHSLLKTPNFSRLPSLEKLMLKDCIRLVEVDQSIGELNMLTFLNLKDCKSLRKLPRTIGSLISLEELVLSGCSRLDDVPRELNNMKSLKVLNLDETDIYRTRAWFPFLSLKRCKELVWASFPSSLVKLSLESCSLHDDAIPNDLCNLASLKSLNLSRNPIQFLPESIKALTKLDELQLTSCKELQMIPKFPILSNTIAIFATISPLKHSWSVVPCFYSFKRCVVFGCERLKEVQGIFKLEPIENFEAEAIKRLFNVDSIDGNQVQLYNYVTDRTVLDTPQVLQECGITSTFVIGSEVPRGFKHRTEDHHMISFSLPTPSRPDEKIRWLSLCIVFSIVSDEILKFLPTVRIFNETKRIMWNHRSSFIGLPESNDNTMMWLIHWPATDFELEGGDIVSCMVVPVHLNIRKFGVTYGSEDTIRYGYEYTHSFPDVDATRNIQMDLTKALLSLNCYENVKVQICNYLEESNVVASSQVLYDYGIVTTIEPIPFDYYGLYYGHQAGKSEVSISVSHNSSPGNSFLLNSMIILSGNNDKTFEFLACLEIVNETKGTKWTYSKHFMGIPETKNMLYWMVSWIFKGDELEAGDRISLRVLSDLSVLEFGAEIVYDYELDDVSNSLHQLPRRSRYSSYLFGAFVYLSSITQRTLYRMQSLVEC